MNMTQLVKRAPVHSELVDMDEFVKNSAHIDAQMGATGDGERMWNPELGHKVERQQVYLRHGLPSFLATAEWNEVNARVLRCVRAYYRKKDDASYEDRKKELEHYDRCAPSI
eukprot:1017766-Pyramimonas_sp.AAC.1